MVYVIDKNGQPLMPTKRHGKVKHLLNEGRAKVVKRCPFTIKLLYDSPTHTQDLTLGVDTGSGTLGAAVYNEQNKDIVYMSEVVVRNDIAKKMKHRVQYRRNRRNRKTRYRACRFLNRHNSIKKNRFSPTMRSKFDSHSKEIEQIKKILPISRLILETGSFDPHLMKNPALADPNVRSWGYQKGPVYDYENIRAMILDRDDHTCQCCHGKEKDPNLEVHHIRYRSQGGTDQPENLITLCHTCHKALHDGKIHPKLEDKAMKGLKHATQMNSIRKQLLRRYPEAIETFGYITKANRYLLDVKKEHYYDACVIASGGKSFSVRCLLYKKKCISKGDFQQTKGSHSEQRVTVEKIHGFRKFDKVRYLGKEYFIKGRMSSGYAILMDIDGKKADFSLMPKGFKTPRLTNLIRIEARKTWMSTQEAVIPNIV